MATTKKSKVENKELAVQETSGIGFNLTAEITAGTLTSNAKELRAKIDSELLNYSIERYMDKPDAAKADKAFLNKVKDSVAEKRKEVMKQWNKPLDEFLDEMKAVEKSVQEASDKLNAIVKEAEAKEKEKKRAEIESYWRLLEFKLVPLERLFNPKWLNKTFSMTDVMKEVEEKIERITGELATVKSLQDENSETLQAFYLETLDLNATLQKGQTLKANRAALKAEEERKKAEEEARKVAAEQAEKTAAFSLNSAENVKNDADFAENTQKTPQFSEKNANFEEKTLLRTFRLEVTGTEKQLWDLRRFIDANGIKFINLDSQRCAK